MAESNTKTPEQIEAERAAAVKAALNKTPLPAKNAPTEPKDPAVPNLTRDALELQLAVRYENEGKSPEQAKELAKKRALEMIP